MKESDTLEFIVPVSVLYWDYNGKVKTGRIYVNKYIVSNTVELFKGLFKQKFPICSIDSSFNRPDFELIRDNITTGYNFRKVEGKDIWSKHAYGTAIDINPKDNPANPTNFGEYYNYSPTIGIITPEVVSIAKSCGFLWGGEIFNTFFDPHHFEI